MMKLLIALATTVALIGPAAAGPLNPEGVKNFTGPYAPMTPQSWKAAADWAEHLHGDHSINIERRDLIEQSAAAEALVDLALRRAAAVATVDEVVKDSDVVATWRFKCPGIGGVEFRKYAVHELGFTIEGRRVEIKGLRGTVTNDGGLAITFRGKQCREVQS